MTRGFKSCRFRTVKHCLLPLLVVATFHQPQVEAAPFPAEFQPRLMSSEEGRAIGAATGSADIGESVAGIGDVNGDGYADFVVSGSRENSGFATHHFLVYGSTSRVDLQLDVELTADSPSNSTTNVDTVVVDGALQITAAGDVNHDGYDDWVFRSSESEYWLVAGQAGYYASPLDVASMTNAQVVPIVNSAVEDDFPEWRIHAAGDMNGDGIDDLVVDEQGVLWLVEGTQQPGFGLFDLANHQRVQLPEAYYQISAGKDVNGDGLTDLLIGLDEAEAYQGLVLVLFGTFDSDTPSVLNRTTLNGQNGFSLASGNSTHGFRLGSRARLSEDVNGDGIDDILLKALGSVYVIYGSSESWPPHVDVDDLSSPSGYVVADIEQSINGIHDLGDINSDGLGDWAARTNSDVHVILGSSVQAGNLDLGSLLVSSGFTIAVTEFGDSLRGEKFETMADRLGDVNGDGIDDILVGDPNGYSLFDYTPGASVEEIEQTVPRQGISYLIFGRTDDGSPATARDLQAALGPGMIELRWQASPSDIQHYEIYRDGEYLAQVGTELLVHIDTDVVLNTGYRYTITAIDSAGLRSSPLLLDVVNTATRFPSISGQVYSDTVAEIFWAYENVEYVVYRDQVPLDTRWAASYLDDAYTSDGHEYHVAVVPNDDFPISLRSRVLRLPDETGASPPSRPQAIQFSVYSDTTLELSWIRSESLLPLRYEVLRDGRLLGSTEGNSYLDTGLQTDDYVIEYTIYAIDSSGNQSEPEQLTVHIESEQQARKPAQAAYFSYVFLSDTSLELSWQLNDLGTQPTGYWVYRDGIQVSTESSPQYLDNDLSANQRYVYTIISYNDEGIRSDPSAVVVQTLGGPNAPESVSAIEYGPNLLELFWARAEGAEGVFSYEVYRDGVLLLNTRGQSYLDQQVEPGVTYRYQIVSVAASSRSEPTPALEIKVSDNEYWVGQ